MSNIRIFTGDLKIAKAILHRYEAVTKQYLYQQCYPLFKRYFDGYYTDCESCIEFINEIYLPIMTSSQKTGMCRLVCYCGESNLTQWLKVVCKFYCYSWFEVKGKKPETEAISLQKKNESGDRLLIVVTSFFVKELKKINIKLNHKK